VSVGKRAFDLLLGVVLLVVSLPVIAVVAALIRWRMGAPVLFRQARTGRGGRSFVLVKFRTMRSAGPDVPISADGERLTGLGRWLRATSLDELPTLWNVLRGTMSLVGPRPLLTYYLDRYTPEQVRRHEVTPGITGWAQVNGRNRQTWEERFALDVWYVDHRSLGLDVRILLSTVWRVLARQDVSADEHATMPEFQQAQASAAEGRA
jgi:sugar transferase EpsL